MAVILQATLSNAFHWMKNKVFWFNFFAIIRWVSSLQLVKIYSNNSVALQRGITLTEPNMTQFNNALMFDHFGRTQWFIVPTEEPWLNSSSLWRQQNDDHIWNDRFKNPLCNETSSSDKKMYRIPLYNALWEIHYRLFYNGLIGIECGDWWQDIVETNFTFVQGPTY